MLDQYYVEPVINNNGINLLIPAAQGNNAGPVLRRTSN
jgi:hypothetical protein